MEKIIYKIKDIFKRLPLGEESERSSKWNLLDYGEVVIHIMNQEQRDTYKCAKVSTMLKLFFGLDITFFSLIPELAYEVKEKGPIPFERLVGTARRHLKPDTNRRR